MTLAPSLTSPSCVALHRRPVAPLSTPCARLSQVRAPQNPFAWGRSAPVSLCSSRCGSCWQCHVGAGLCHRRVGCCRLCGCVGWSGLVSACVRARSCNGDDKYSYCHIDRLWRSSRRTERCRCICYFHTTLTVWRVVGVYGLRALSDWRVHV